MAETAAKTSAGAPATALPIWPDEVYRVLKEAGIRQVAMVPDAGHSRLIRAFEADPATRLDRCRPDPCELASAMERTV